MMASRDDRKPKGDDSEASDGGELEKLSREVVEMLQAEKTRKRDKKAKRKVDQVSSATQLEVETDRSRKKPDE